MSRQIAPVPAHPGGEAFEALQSSSRDVLVPPLSVDTVGRRFQMDCGLPVRYTSPNAPSVRDVLGTSVLAILSGACRYAHVSALRGDQVNPQGLGMEKVASEDSLRRAFQNEDAAALAQWQTEALLATYKPALERPWIADLDVTVKPIYGHQEGAEIGYNPRKPDRPSHAYHTVFLRTLRVALQRGLL